MCAVWCLLDFVLLMIMCSKLSNNCTMSSDNNENDTPHGNSPAIRTRISTHTTHLRTPQCDSRRGSHWRRQQRKGGESHDCRASGWDSVEEAEEKEREQIAWAPHGAFAENVLFFIFSI